MLEFILDILFNNPEGLTFALFGLKKKRRKAERLIRQMEEKGIPELDALNSEGGIPDIPQFDNSIPRTTSITTPPNSISYQPEFPYRGKQIIIDSDRVLLNAKDDSVFIIGDKAVGISTNGTFNIDSSGKTIINSSQIDLGLDAEESAVKGDTLVKVFNEYLLGINTLVVPQLKEATDANNVKIANVNRAGEALEALTKLLNEDIKATLSDIVKIK
jgi:hypothetical protein|tara:strand:+ start:5513 stop:6160 length:648 start_codon:yes stop_codon:yes gene_type:complete